MNRETVISGRETELPGRETEISGRETELPGREKDFLKAFSHSFLRNTAAVSPVYGAVLLLGLSVMVLSLLAVSWVPAAVHDQEAAVSESLRFSVSSLAADIGAASAGNKEELIFCPDMFSRRGNDIIAGTVFPELSAVRPASSFSVMKGEPVFLDITGKKTADPSGTEGRKRSVNDDPGKQKKDIVSDEDGYNENAYEDGYNENAYEDVYDEEADGRGETAELKTDRKILSGDAIRICCENTRFPGGEYSIDGFSSVVFFQKDGCVRLFPSSVFSADISREDGSSVPMIMIRSVSYESGSSGSSDSLSSSGSLRSSGSSVYDSSLSAVLTVTGREKEFYEAEKIVFRIPPESLMKDPERSGNGTVDGRDAGSGNAYGSKQEDLQGTIDVSELAGRIDENVFLISDDGNGNLTVSGKNGGTFIVCLQRTIFSVS